ncbi:hypothetical protein FOL47_007977 [Perkinsus chesapeaki]|uniref:Uncharacterized protein n=1 Tax=Perkinsus chesapeaki TaxID=330153 RepID=A0A7J6LGL2_PERCH|nr:hypothetical protein FOL47_007977 [Perkinsus chesapeaki]
MSSFSIKTLTLLLSILLAVNSSTSEFGASYFPSEEVLSEPAPPSNDLDLPSFEQANSSTDEEEPFDDQVEPFKSTTKLDEEPPSEKFEPGRGYPEDLFGGTEKKDSEASFDAQARQESDEEYLDKEDEVDEDGPGLVGGRFATGTEKNVEVGEHDLPEIDHEALQEAFDELKKDDDEGDDDGEADDDDQGDEEPKLQDIPGEWIPYGTCREILALEPQGGIDTAIRSAFITSINVDGRAFKLRNPGGEDIVMSCPTELKKPVFVEDVGDYLMKIDCLESNKNVPEIYKVRCDNEEDAERLRSLWNGDNRTDGLLEVTTTTTRTSVPETVWTTVTIPTRPPLPEYLEVEIFRHDGDKVFREMPTYPTIEEKMKLHEVHLLLDSLEIVDRSVAGYTLSGNRARILCRDRDDAETLMLKFSSQIETVSVEAGRFSPEMAEEAEATVREGVSKCL